MKPIKAIPTIIVTVVTLLLIGAAVLPGLRIKLYPNDSNPPDTAAFIMEETTTDNHILMGQLRLRMTNGLATITYVNSITNAGTNVAGILASNNVRVAEGVGIVVNTQSSSGLMIYTVGANRLRSLVPSTTTTQQIDVASGPTSYYWTNMVTNVVCQLTNVWTSSVSNRPLDFFFTGATNNGPNYTVTFTCPNPGGVIFHWGVFIPTNGATSFSVTNAHTASATITAWDTNSVEGFYSPGI